MSQDDPCNPSVVCSPRFQGVIFPAAWGFHADGVGFEYWTPGEGQVLEAEDRLPAFLQNAAPQLAAKLANFRRQYVGVARRGQRLIYLNLFVDPKRRDWLTQPVVCDDGGDDYFQLLYDVDSGEFSDLSINGEA